MISKPPSPSAADLASGAPPAGSADPLLPRRTTTVRLWVVLGAILTILAVAAIVAAVLITRQGPLSPVPIPTGVPR